MGRRLAFAIADAVAVFDARLQPSLWDAPAAAVLVAPATRTPKPLRTVPLSLSGKRPDRDTRLVVTGEREAAAAVAARGRHAMRQPVLIAAS